MATLMNQTKNNSMLVGELKVADNFKTRLFGLMGKKSLPDDQGVYFPKCNWIHTFFMSMTIDVIYLDSKLKVKKLQRGLSPWKMPAPVFGARSVVEVNSGFIDKKSIEVGDQLHVGH